ncbi:hypothetical protein M885DRAFT_550047 [Pelagophyceae sp. CCMP2097]|nr:hypothetical protein M885DRAFT_550047 [Pelagophyceae sp. CCMP2097]
MDAAASLVARELWARVTVPILAAAERKFGMSHDLAPYLMIFVGFAAASTSLKDALFALLALFLSSRHLVFFMDYLDKPGRLATVQDELDVYRGQLDKFKPVYTSEVKDSMVAVERLDILYKSYTTPRVYWKMRAQMRQAGLSAALVEIFLTDIDLLRIMELRLVTHNIESWLQLALRHYPYGQPETQQGLRDIARRANRIVALEEIAQNSAKWLAGRAKRP